MHISCCRGNLLWLTNVDAPTSGGTCWQTKAGPAQMNKLRMSRLSNIDNIFMLVGQFIAKILTKFRGEGGPWPRMAHQTLRPWHPLSIYFKMSKF
jgi:hypothetical protein